MSFLKALRLQDPSSPVAYHLEGLVEAAERIRWHLGYLDAAVGLDPEGLARRMVDLQVEIFDHMGYHMKELRRPFARLISKAFRDLERLEHEAKRPPEKARKSTSRGTHVARKGRVASRKVPKRR